MVNKLSGSNINELIEIAKKGKNKSNERIERQNESTKVNFEVIWKIKKYLKIIFKIKGNRKY